jgi:hypothetical protein
VFPTDGAVSVPGPIAITAACANPTAAPLSAPVPRHGQLLGQSDKLASRLPESP